MRPDFPTAALEQAWAPARAAGAVGSASVAELREHTAGFLSAVCSVFPPESRLTGLDVGSGAGIPGLLLAWELLQTSWVLLDASQRRCDFASAAMTALALESRVSVVHGRADNRPPVVSRETMDVVTARLLASPAETLELCAPYCRPGGIIVASFAARDRPLWERATDVSGIGSIEFSAAGEANFVCVRVVDGLDPALPRRPKARARRPLIGD